jgi:carbamoyl-phosphate synthase large subunit
MPINENVRKVLVIGSGPIIIGQAAEFDYSGTQACEALREEGIEVILINSNPATIMTDKKIANKVYIEPITLEFVEKIIIKETPDSLIASMGGQTAINIVIELNDKGLLEKYNIKLIGTSIEAIKKGEDRENFRNLLKEIYQPYIEGEIVTDIESGKMAARKIGYPLVVRPAYTLGGSGGGIANNEEEIEIILKQGIMFSSINQVIIEKSVKGWKEIEYEVIRDSYGNCITVCNMENIDPVGIHTGDSIVVAPSQTLSDIEYQMLRDASIHIVNAVGIEGACNVQFALNPKSSEYAIIEINPRVSRSSALASKATGYPIARVATKIALGYRLDEIRNSVTKKTYACFEPALDYVAIKIPRWSFEKFYEADRVLGTKMMATGEVLSIGRTFEAALLKGIRSLENDSYTLENKYIKNKSLEELKKSAILANDERIFVIAEMMRRSYRLEAIASITGIDRFFLYKIKNIVEKEEELRNIPFSKLSKKLLLELKKIGFSDKGIGYLLNISAEEIFKVRSEWGIVPSYKIVDTCAGEFEASSPYYYSTYGESNEVEISDKKKIIIIGSGPIRIGQGVEFDYSSVHAIKALKERKIETIIINNNPETVSTDFDISDKLYFEPITEEDVFSIIDMEKPWGVIVQFGGQTAIKLAKFLSENNINILGITSDQIDEVEDREKFDMFLEKLGIARPIGKAVRSIREGYSVAKKIGYPVIVRPSFVLGGQGMKIVYEENELGAYLKKTFIKDNKNSVLIDKYFMGMEIEVDAICDEDNILIPGIMEHVERAGIHSGDSISIYPPQNISKDIIDKVLYYSKIIAINLSIKGLINIQFVEYCGDLYVIEVNPRASRTVPFISKVTGVPVVELATAVMLGEKLINLGYGTDIYKENRFVAVKVPVFSTQKIHNAEISLGPEMKSTGEVIGIGRSLYEALYKGFLAANMMIKSNRKIVVASIRDSDKKEFIDLALQLGDLNYSFISTTGTAKLLRELGLKVKAIEEGEIGESDILSFIRNKEVDFVINTPTKGNDSSREGFHIRRRSIEENIQVITSLDTLKSLVDIMKISEANFDIERFQVFDIARI